MEVHFIPRSAASPILLSATSSGVDAGEWQSSRINQNAVLHKVFLFFIIDASFNKLTNFHMDPSPTSGITTLKN